MFGRKAPAPRQRVEKCKIKVKVNRDGSQTKEISGNCTKEQLAALSREGMKGSSISFADEEF